MVYQAVCKLFLCRNIKINHLQYSMNPEKHPDQENKHQDQEKNQDQEKYQNQEKHWEHDKH